MNSTGQLSSVWIQTPTTRDSLKFFKWWPGWDRGLHSRNFPRALMQVPGGVKPGITLSRKFDGRLTDYYFWNIKPSNISLPFICEKKQRRQEELGCFYGQVWSLTQFLAYSLVRNTVFSNHPLCWGLRSLNKDWSLNTNQFFNDFAYFLVGFIASLNLATTKADTTGLI